MLVLVDPEERMKCFPNPRQARNIRIMVCDKALKLESELDKAQLSSFQVLFNKEDSNSDALSLMQAELLCRNSDSESSKAIEWGHTRPFDPAHRPFAKFRVARANSELKCVISDENGVHLVQNEPKLHDLEEKRTQTHFFELIWALLALEMNKCAKNCLQNALKPPETILDKTVTNKA